MLYLGCCWEEINVLAVLSIPLALHLMPWAFVQSERLRSRHLISHLVHERMTSYAKDMQLSSWVGCISPHSGVCILVSHLQSSRRHNHLIYPANGAERRRCYPERAP